VSINRNGVSNIEKNEDFMGSGKNKDVSDNSVLMGRVRRIALSGLTTGSGIYSPSFLYTGSVPSVMVLDYRVRL
jgi:hypothetical protein